MESCPICKIHELLYPLECGHGLCLKCLKGICFSTTDGKCPTCSAQLSAVYKARINVMPAFIRDVGPDIDARIEALFTLGDVWAYSSRKTKGCCWLYDESTQLEIKHAKVSGSTILNAMACGCRVDIDLQRGRQVNPVTGTMRHVRVFSADTPLIKGIAGMPRARRVPPTTAPGSSGPGPLPAKVSRNVGESLKGYRLRILAAFLEAGQEERRNGEKKVPFNRRVKAWADGGSH